MPFGGVGGLEVIVGVAAGGASGGWEPGDPGSRGFVPGLVEVPTPEGGTELHRPQDLQPPVEPLPFLTRKRLAEFLRAGQSYE